MSLEEQRRKAFDAWQRAQGAVPDVSAMAKVLSDRVASACCVDPDDNWKIYGQEFIEDVRAMLAAAPAQPVVQAAVGVPYGWVIAPQEIHLSASDIELINGMCGDGNEESGYGPYQDGTLYIGYALQDDGSKVYGLHISCDECPEEGVATLAEFSAATAHPAERQDKKPLDERMRAAGMMTVADRLAGAPLDAFFKHAGVNDLSSLLQWAEMRRADWLKMQARYDLGERDKSDELYEWTIAHCAVFTDLHVNIRAALAGEKERQEVGEVQRLREALKASRHMLHQLDDGDQCQCSQCEFVRLRDAALAQPAAHDQGEVQRLREALGRIRKQAVELECKQSPCSATQRDFAEIAYMADAALAASTGQEVEE